IVAGHLFGEAGPRVWLLTALTGAAATALGTVVAGSLIVVGGLGGAHRAPPSVSWPLWAANTMFMTIAPLPGPSRGAPPGAAGGLPGPFAPLGQVLAALRRGTADLSWLTGDSVEVAVAGMAAFLRGA